MIETKLCDNCGQPVGPGRSDKKFCSPECKTEFNNKKEKLKKEEPDPRVQTYIEAVQKELLRNRHILATCCPGWDNSESIPLSRLKDMNFNFNYFTRETEINGEGKIYRMCFEYGYRIKSAGTVVIFRRPSLLDAPPLNGEF